MTNSLPKITIITPSYNQGRFIEQTIKSVLSQNYPNLEYIVIDGGSTDNTIEILKKHEGGLKWISEKDKGQSDAINKGLKMATGDIIAWLNSDDYYLPGTLMKVAAMFHDENVQWVTGDYIIIDENGKTIQSFIRIYKKILAQFSCLTALSLANYINQPSTFWRRSIQEKVGYLDEDLHFCMDYDLWLRYMKESPVYRVSSPLSAFRIHKSSKGGSQYKKQFKEELNVIKKYNKNNYLYWLHEMHNNIISFIYSFIK